MLEKLRKVVFGEEEYQKTKIEVRFQIISDILLRVEINSLDDFEIIESCIYKIKDQLRVKSSNLNKTISKSNNFSKKKVIEVLDNLINIRNNFLNRAFKAIKEVEDNKSNNEDKEFSKINSNLISNLLILEDVNKTIHLIVNKNTPILKICWKKDVDLIYLKNLSSIFFDLLGSQGTNIINSNKNSYIIPRNLRDNILQNPKIIGDLDLEEVKSNLLSNIELKNNFNENLDNEIGSDFNDDEYIEVNKKEEFHTKKIKKKH